MHTTIFTSSIELPVELVPYGANSGRLHRSYEVDIEVADFLQERDEDAWIETMHGRFDLTGVEWYPADETAVLYFQRHFRR